MLRPEPLAPNTPLPPPTEKETVPLATALAQAAPRAAAHPHLGSGTRHACCTFAVIVLRELIASAAAALPLAAERAHGIDAGLSKPAAVAACDAFIDV